MAQDIVTKIESNKILGIAAIGAAIFAGIGIVLVAKEVMEARKAAAVKKVAVKELADVVEASPEGDITASTEAKSGCGGCSSNASGTRYVKTPYEVGDYCKCPSNIRGQWSHGLRNADGTCNCPKQAKIELGL